VFVGEKVELAVEVFVGVLVAVKVDVFVRVLVGVKVLTEHGGTATNSNAHPIPFAVAAVTAVVTAPVNELELSTIARFALEVVEPPVDAVTALTFPTAPVKLVESSWAKPATTTFPAATLLIIAVTPVEVVVTPWLCPSDTPPEY